MVEEPIIFLPLSSKEVSVRVGLLTLRAELLTRSTRDHRARHYYYYYYSQEVHGECASSFTYRHRNTTSVSFTAYSSMHYIIIHSMQHIKAVHGMIYSMCFVLPSRQSAGACALAYDGGISGICCIFEHWWLSGSRWTKPCRGFPTGKPRLLPFTMRMASLTKNETSMPGAPCR